MNNLKNKTNNIKLADTVKSFLILAIGFALPLQVIAQPQPSKVPIKVRVLKRRQIHIETAALLCALQETGASKSQLQEAWREKLDIPVNADDQFLVISIMRGMCPGVQPQKPSS